jgi:anti-sigma regulatory factor (Ser/Thr protein kinase)
MPVEQRGADGLSVLVHEIAEPEAVPLARAVLTRFAERESAPESVQSAVALAVTEACTNVVLHAYVDAEAPGYLEVSAGRTDGVLHVEVRDEGRGMVPRVGSPGLGLGLPLNAPQADVFEIRTRRAQARHERRMQFQLARP